MLSRLNDAHETTHIHLLHILKLAELCASKFRLWNFGFLIENLVKKSSFWSDYCASFSLIPTTHPTHTPPTQNFFYRDYHVMRRAAPKQRIKSRGHLFTNTNIYFPEKKVSFLYISPPTNSSFCEFYCYFLIEKKIKSRVAWVMATIVQ